MPLNSKIVVLIDLKVFKINPKCFPVEKCWSHVCRETTW